MNGLQILGTGRALPEHVVTNDEPDPTRRYGTIGGPGGGSGYDSGSYQPDLQTGPPRL